jgi:mRNA-degrading endonuclease toxin of MazEF toxin-antitoxin module
VPPSGDIKPGDIYFVTIRPAETRGSEQHSRRPFVIVSRLSLNLKSTIVSGIPLTTTGAGTNRHPPQRIHIPANEIAKDVCYSGTVQDSVALTDQVRVLAKERLETKMGTLSDTALAAIGAGLNFLFNL